MENLRNKWTCHTCRSAARALGVTVWQIRYAIESGYLPAPSVVLRRRPLFSEEQVETMRAYFEMESVVKRRATEAKTREAKEGGRLDFVG